MGRDKVVLLGESSRVAVTDLLGLDTLRVIFRVHDGPVIPPEDLLRVPRGRVVVSVVGVQARHAIRQVMTRLECVELHDFVCAA